jgi:NADP-dependent 3-hydroxy acid dehydrogenase YdfG
MGVYAVTGSASGMGHAAGKLRAAGHRVMECPRRPYRRWQSMHRAMTQFRPLIGIIGESSHGLR